MKHRTVSVTEFKARCLGLLDELGSSGGAITITRRGKPLATVRPAPKRSWKTLQGAWAGRLEIPDPLEIDLTDSWNVVRESETKS